MLEELHEIIEDDKIDNSQDDEDCLLGDDDVGMKQKVWLFPLFLLLTIADQPKRRSVIVFKGIHTVPQK